MKNTMSLNDFIAKYDRENSIVLLEGKRDVKPKDEQKLIALGEKLTLETEHIVFRSGNAEGSDELFSKGVAKINPERLQVIIPYNNHRIKHILSKNIVSLDDIDLSKETHIIENTCINPAYKRLVDCFMSGRKSRMAAQARYILRDTLKVSGSKNVKKASFGIFYDDLTEPGKGGTGHTMNVCNKIGIEIIDQRTWFNWQ